MKLLTYPAPKSNEVADRIKRAETLIRELGLAKGSSVLDLGGCEYKNFCSSLGFSYTTLNLSQPLTSGTGGYTVDKDTILYDGKTLPFEKNAFDLIICNFVLHHAAENTLQLLRQMASVSKQYILIGEDLSELDYGAQWHKRNFDHQPGGLYRSNQEWLELFSLFGLECLVLGHIQRKDDEVPGKMYRVLYLLQKRAEI